MHEAITDKQSFQETIAASEPVVIHFSTDWCPDCRRFEAFFPSVEEKFSTLPMYEVDRDKLSDIGEEYEVRGIPSLLVFKDGKKTAHLHSADLKSPEDAEEFLSKYFK
ncbi:thioredoxin family protein [Sinobaca sp. H24]|uniref:thioredoxin family protein n=1 Tax=Sinobaca sp. H24 TaxID=2923376 RepID=UPI00207A9F5C|nr:thioredoxin family protein [Sinobaca sp. H24]